MKLLKKFLAVLAAGAIIMANAAFSSFAYEDCKGVVIVHVNDVHCGINADDESYGYADLAAYKAMLEEQGYETLLVDAGDFSQGGAIGTLSGGEYIVDIMNKLDFDLATPGNHEFDYGFEQLKVLSDKADFSILSSNLISLETGESVFDGWKVIETDCAKIGFVGITTPESLTKSDPAAFRNNEGKYILGLCGGGNNELYKNVQRSVDEAKAAGAEYVVALAHLGTDEQSGGWTSETLIANTEGIDAVIDGHSHSVIDGEKVLNKNGKEVILASTGTKLSNIGTISLVDGKLSSALIKKGDYTVSDNEESKEHKAYASANEFIGNIEAKYEELVNKVVAYSEVDLTDEIDGEWAIRRLETNLGDFCADAYRIMLDADVAVINGGGIREKINAGDITYGDIIAVHPYGNALCVVEATGQEILDALELGAMENPDNSGGFLQVSGMTYEIHTYIPSSVILDNDKRFVRVDGKYRVKNVTIGGKLLDPKKIYTLASHNYMLKSGGDGFTMFSDNNFILDEVILDNQALIDYITEKLDGKIDESYADPRGDGRITICNDISSADNTSEIKSPETGTAGMLSMTVIMIVSAGIAFAFRRRK